MAQQVASFVIRTELTSALYLFAKVSLKASPQVILRLKDSERKVADVQIVSIVISVCSHYQQDFHLLLYLNESY